MKRPSVASLKKVTVENLTSLGAERLAELLVGVADTRPDLKRRLRMELAAVQGPAALAAEIDKRLTALESSHGKITWRQRPAFLRDLDGLRELITSRLALLDQAAATDRLWRYMDAARQSERRYRDRNGEMAAVYERAAADLGRLIADASVGPAAATLVESVTGNPASWKAWLPSLLDEVPAAVAKEALRSISERRGAVPGWITLIRQLADAAGDIDAFIATYTPDTLLVPSVAAQIAQRLVGMDRIEEAGDILRKAAPTADVRRKTSIDFDWETEWIAYLERAAKPQDAQAVRWSSFERTLSVARVREFIGKLADFDDVEAEQRAFEVAARHNRFERGLRLLMEWPALGEASRMIERRRDEIVVDVEAAELWAAQLRMRFPNAAYALLRGAAAAAFRRRDFEACDRLSAEAETISVI